MNSDLLLNASPDRASHRYRPQRHGLRVRLLARVLAPSLDRQLAEGHPRRAGRALEVRAGEIVSPACRRELARRWTGVIELANQPPVPRSPRARLCRGRIAGAEPELREMIAVLTGGLPITARGVAMASWLLRDGTGPLHNHLSPLDLGEVVREATCQMAAPADAQLR